MFPTTIRTGLGTGHDAFPNDEHVIRRAVSFAAVVTTRAATTAALLAEHANRDVIGVEDVHASLKYHAMTLFQSEGLEEEVDQAERELFLQPDSESEWETVSETESQETESQETESQEPHLTRVCECGVCAAVKDADAKWDTWEPTDPAEVYMKNAVDKTITACI